jgi:hypothetical protein
MLRLVDDFHETISKSLAKKHVSVDKSTTETTVKINVSYVPLLTALTFHWLAHRRGCMKVGVGGGCVQFSESV